jgi:hypothetical protein
VQILVVGNPICPSKLHTKSNAKPVKGKNYMEKMTEMDSLSNNISKSRAVDSTK